MIIIIAIIAVLVIVSVLLLYLFPLIKIDGDSMFPTYSEGEVILGSRLFNKNNCKSGKVYIILLKNDENNEPYYIVKRLSHIDYDPVTGNPLYFFLGDNLRVSADSRVFGYFKPNQIVARVLKERRNENSGEES